ncbi:hypothetical protein N271_gp54 [Salmonella phage Jersey]|uniref:Uncharacterized protein n=1 Tax=Salmonella phage Jersey TaxID=1340534 RepID=S4WZQ2_9CAUD|nr:hypothetical protein N271_gp54 [Salmonella phage Jersey]AGP24942.1 hypothetical protein Jersey_54 [Salmonella phage Jersey]
MLKKGQLPRHKISGNCYFVYCQNPTGVLLLPGHRIHGRTSFDVAGNNYTAKDAKESAPANPGS